MSVRRYDEHWNPRPALRLAPVVVSPEQIRRDDRRQLALTVLACAAILALGILLILRTPHVDADTPSPTVSRVLGCAQQYGDPPVLHPCARP